MSIWELIYVKGENSNIIGKNIGSLPVTHDCNMYYSGHAIHRNTIITRGKRENEDELYIYIYI